MNFAQYCILLLASLFVIITVINLSKMVVLITKETKNNSQELDAGIRNLLISVGLLSIASFIYIVLVFLG
jgi:hypothetical protein